MELSHECCRHSPSGQLCNDIEGSFNVGFGLKPNKILFFCQLQGVRFRLVRFRSFRFETDTFRSKLPSTAAILMVIFVDLAGVPVIVRLWVQEEITVVLSPLLGLREAVERLEMYGLEQFWRSIRICIDCIMAASWGCPMRVGSVPSSFAL